MDQETREELAKLEDKINDVRKDTKKIRNYMQINLWITVAVFVLPLLALLIIVPRVISQYMSLLNSL